MPEDEKLSVHMALLGINLQTKIIWAFRHMCLL